MISAECYFYACHGAIFDNYIPKIRSPNPGNYLVYNIVFIKYILLSVTVIMLGLQLAFQARIPENEPIEKGFAMDRKSKQNILPKLIEPKLNHRYL